MTPEAVIGAYTRLFSSVDGQIVLKDLLKETGVLNLLKDEKVDWNVALYKMGQMDVGKYILKMLNSNYMDIIKMTRKAESTTSNDVAKQMFEEAMKVQSGKVPSKERAYGDINDVLNKEES